MNSDFFPALFMLLYCVCRGVSIRALSLVAASPTALSNEEKIDADARSIWVGNVRMTKFFYVTSSSIKYDKLYQFVGLWLVLA